MTQTDFTDNLRRHGFRATPQRLAILDVLSASGGHLAPQEVAQRARDRLPGLNEATVYRTLDFLTRQGLILCAHLGGGRVVYEMADHHHHLICHQCGRTVQVAHDLLHEVYTKIIATTGFRLDTSHLTFFGLCPECRATSATPATTFAD
jgi:Fe2+ or Zn2+ uptake regulation protein